MLGVSLNTFYAQVTTATAVKGNELWISDSEIKKNCSERNLFSGT